jgi:hypothetical protein
MLTIGAILAAAALAFLLCCLFADVCRGSLSAAVCWCGGGASMLLELLGACLAAALEGLTSN